MFKIGDIVNNSYKHSGFTKAVFFIIAGSGSEALLAQEVHPYSHYEWSTVDRIRPASFTNIATKDVEIYRQKAIKNNVWRKQQAEIEEIKRRLK